MTRVQLIACVLLAAAITFAAPGCASNVDRLDEAIEATHTRVSLVESALADIEAAPANEIDEESRAAAAALRAQLERLEAWLEQAETYRDAIAGEDAFEVGQNIGSLLSASGVPYAGLIAAIFGSAGAWWRERRRTDQLIRNVNSAGVVRTAEPEQRKMLESLNVATGLERRVEKVVG